MFLNFIILHNWSRERREDMQNLMEMTNDRESYQYIRATVSASGYLTPVKI